MNPNGSLRIYLPLVDGVVIKSERPMLPVPPPRRDPRGRPRLLPRGGCLLRGFPIMSNENETEKITNRFCY